MTQSQAMKKILVFFFYFSICAMYAQDPVTNQQIKKAQEIDEQEQIKENLMIKISKPRGNWRGKTQEWFYKYYG